jgi:ubiquinol-cytochrome c reductase cytochrome b subunit
LLHGYETGRILRLPSGEFLEIHEPIGEAEKAKLLAKADVTPLELPSKVDANGVKNPKAAKSMARAKLSQWFYSDVIPTPTDEEMQAAAEHAAHELHAAESHLKEISQH